MAKAKGASKDGGGKPTGAARQAMGGLVPVRITESQASRVAWMILNGRVAGNEVPEAVRAILERWLQDAWDQYMEDRRWAQSALEKGELQPDDPLFEYPGMADLRSGAPAVSPASSSKRRS